MNKYGLIQNVNNEYEVWLDIWANDLRIEKIEEVGYPGFYDWFVIADGVRIEYGEEITIEEINGNAVRTMG